MVRKQKNQASRKINCKSGKCWRSLIPLIYIAVPSILILLLPKLFLRAIVNFMSTMSLSGIEIANSQHAINQVIIPFCNAILLILGFVISYLGIRFIERKISERVDYKISAKKWLKVIEIIIVLLTVSSVIYANVKEFPHEQYGYSIETLRNITDEQEVKNIPLEKFITINSLGLKSKDANIFYNMLMEIAQLFYSISNNFDIFIALAGGIILPLKHYVELENKNG